eukprot:1177123-Prorocentrum_minimum.AAC.1
MEKKRSFRALRRGTRIHDVTSGLGCVSRWSRPMRSFRGGRPWASAPCPHGPWRRRCAPQPLKQGLHTETKPLLSHSTTEEFNSPLNICGGRKVPELRAVH